MGSESAGRTSRCLSGRQLVWTGRKGNKAKEDKGIESLKLQVLCRMSEHRCYIQGKRQGRLASQEDRRWKSRWPHFKDDYSIREDKEDTYTTPFHQQCRERYGRRGGKNARAGGNGRVLKNAVFLVWQGYWTHKLIAIGVACTTPVQDRAAFP